MENNIKYRIGDFSRLIGISAYTLRYYENEGLLQPKRDSTKQRYYTKADEKWLEFLMHLKGTGMTIPELKQYVDWRAIGDSTIHKRLKLLKKVQQRAIQDIQEKQQNLQVLNHKINWYKGKENMTIDESESFEAYLKRIEILNTKESVK